MFCVIGTFDKCATSANAPVFVRHQASVYISSLQHIFATSVLIELPPRAARYLPLMPCGTRLAIA